ncbi:hypothetical protein [Mucilaginibacter psychrotolerans]|uniref:Uncharacterized protein n=1 Tax=Mucilaginibacter psychrotolerans TaxID=1524096 RepID=A0A4Y8SKZ8_9SPHI|nr:hypothetical protein [Mucilaginibacter psychrotolerans]TFF39729.1 hypothetical protein E2R66_05015 [Mucilaginibacter psychrotolerans]
MERNDLGKCVNCGAGLQPETPTTLKCPYCGSVLGISVAELPEPVAELAKRGDANQVMERMATNVAKNENQNQRITVILVGAIAFLVIIVAIWGPSADKNPHYASLDSLSIDTTAKKNKAGADSNAAEQRPFIISALKELSSISVDKATFKKLYADARKKRDEFSNSKFIYDKTSPRYTNVSGVYAYIEAHTTDYEFRFRTQYVAENWLFIERMTINTDGENTGLSPSFERDNGDGKIWEWSDDAASDDELRLFINIAKAKKAKIKYDGEKYYDTVTITPKQQAALKRQLQIYKGLLLKYDKP